MQRGSPDTWVEEGRENLVTVFWHKSLTITSFSVKLSIRMSIHRPQNHFFVPWSHSKLWQDLFFFYTKKQNYGLMKKSLKGKPHFFKHGLILIFFHKIYNGNVCWGLGEGKLPHKWRKSRTTVQEGVLSKSSVIKVGLLFCGRGNIGW